MDDEVETVDQYPVGRDIPLDMIWSMPDRLESCLDPVGDRLHLSGASTRADDEVVREAPGLLQVEHDDVVDVLFGGGEGLTPDALPDIEVKEIMDSLFH